MKIKIIFLIVLLSVTASRAIAGWVFIQSSEGDKQTLYIQDNNMKIVATDQIMIFMLDKNMVSFANPKEKTYWMETPEAFSAQVRKGMENLDQMIDQQLTRVPPRQKAAFKQTIRQQMRKQITSRLPRIEVKPAGPPAKIAGYDVKKYEIQVNGQLRQEQWIAEDIKISETFDVKQYGKMMRAFHGGLGKGSDDAALSSPEVIALLEKGWPLKKVDYDEDGYPETEEVVKVVKRPIQNTTFVPPQDYRRISMAEIFGK